VASSPSSKGPSSSKYVAKSSPSAKKPAAKSKSKAAQSVAAKAAARAFAPAPSAPSATAGMTSTDKVIWICLHLLVFLVPIAMSNFSWIERFVAGGQMMPLTYDQFDIVKVFVMRACALGGLAAWAFQFFFRGGKLRRTKLDWLIVGFLGWVLLTSFTSISPATALFGKYRRFEGFFSFLTYAIVYFLVVQLVDRPSRIRSITRTFLASSLIVAGYGALQSIGADPLRWGALPFEVNRAFSTFGNPDLLGGFLIFPLVISIAMAFSEPDYRWRIFYWSTFLITMWAWIAAFVRGAWIGGAVGLAILVAAAIIAKLKLHPVDWSFLGLTGIAGSALVIRSLSNANTVMNVWERLKSILAFGEGSALTRFEIWQAAIDAIKAKPIFGFGADTFRLVFPKYKPLAYVKDAGYLSVADNVHDYPLQLMAGIGIIGFLLLYGIFGWALWLGAPNAFSRGKGPERLVIAGFWAAAVGYIVHLFTGLSVTGSTVFLWMSLAIIVSPTARETQHKAPAWGAIVGTLLIATLAVGFVGNCGLTYADNVFLRGQFPTATEDPIALNKQAIALDPFNDIYRSMLGKSYENVLDYWITQVTNDRKNGTDAAQSLEQVQAAFTEAENMYTQTIALVPTEYDNYLFLSALYNKVGPYLGQTYFDKAQAAADAGIAVEPYGPGVRLQKAVAQASLGDVNGALTTVLQAATMDPNYTDPRQFAAQLYASQGKYAEAIGQFQELLKAQPGNATWTDAIQSLEASAGISPTNTAPAPTAPATGTSTP
jgi:putative inorganic carbon (HCO3(-)) transporter